MSLSVRIGVLALQGAFIEHENKLKSLSSDNLCVNVVEVKTSEDMKDLDGIVLPGGESTAMRIIAQGGESRGNSIFATLKELARSGKPMWGTCAGCILLSNHVSSSLGGGDNHTERHLESVKAASLYGEQHIGGIDINTCRNYFGRQTKSFQTVAESTTPDFNNFPCVFIRAPAIATVGEAATRLALIRYGGEEITVAARQGNLLATCFHPELSEDNRVHNYFLSMVKASRMQ